MGLPSTKYSEGKMREAGSGKVDAGVAQGDKQIPPNIGNGGAGEATKKVESPLTSSKAQIPPMKASPTSKPIMD